VDLGELPGIHLGRRDIAASRRTDRAGEVGEGFVNGILLATGFTCAAAFQSPRSMARRAGIAAAA
jgi:hypothetical protein